MGNLFSANIDTKPLKSALTALKKEAKAALDNQLKDSADKIASQARANCRIPSISGSIRSGKGQRGYTVSAGKGLLDEEIAAYHEFGTGDFARATVSGLPADWTAYALTFYKNGMGRLPASPYLYPAFYSEVTKYINMKKLVS